MTKKNDGSGENEVADYQSDCGKSGALEGRVMADAGGGEMTADDADNGNGATNQRGHRQGAQLPRFGPGFLHGGQGNGGGKGLGHRRGSGSAGLGDRQGFPASRAGDFVANVAGVAQNFLAASGAVEFKVAHGKNSARRVMWRG